MEHQADPRVGEMQILPAPSHILCHLQALGQRIHPSRPQGLGHGRRNHFYHPMEWCCMSRLFQSLVLAHKTQLSLPQVLAQMTHFYHQQGLSRMTHLSHSDPP